MLAATVTAVSAVLVFVVTQSFLKLVLEPIQAQRELVGEVTHALVFHANVFAEFSPPKDLTDGREMKIGSDHEEVEETRKALRGLAGRLRASLWTVPLYDALARLGWVWRKEDVLKASDHLIGWSNTLRRGWDSGRDKHQKIIADSLGITEKLEASRLSRTKDREGGSERPWWRRVLGG